MRLLTKIFLWFWLTLTVVGGVLLVSFWLLDWEPPNATFFDRPFRRQRREVASQALTMFTERAIAAYESGRPPVLRRSLENMQRMGIRVWLFDGEGRELSGRPYPPRLDEMVEAALRNGSAEVPGDPRTLLISRLATSPRGAQYVMAAEVPRHLFGGGTGPVDLLVRIVVVLVTGGLLCYALARYLTKPIRQLQRAAREVAAGNLSARVAGAVGERGDELAELGRDFDEMAERIEALLNSQRRLLRDISHELRSPLARMSVALELARKKSSPEVEPLLLRIEREADSMNLMIAQLLTLSRLESETGSLMEPVDLSTLVEAVVSDARFEGEASDRSLRFEGSPGIRVKGQPRLLRSALENLIRNALQHTPEGTPVDVSLSRDGDSVRVRVRDFGPGVPEFELANIFRPFYRIEESRDRRSGGTGLGLAIAKRVIEHHGGSISARLAEGGGLEVTVRIPAE